MKVSRGWPWCALAEGGEEGGGPQERCCPRGVEHGLAGREELEGIDLSGGFNCWLLKGGLVVFLVCN